MQQLNIAHPPAYLIENTAFQFNVAYPEMAAEHFAYVCKVLGTPLTFDSAQVGSYAHRLRNYWTNLCHTSRFDVVLQEIVPPVLQVVDIMEPGRLPMEVYKDDSPPWYPVNLRGKP